MSWADTSESQIITNRATANIFSTLHLSIVFKFYISVKRNDQNFLYLESLEFFYTKALPLTLLDLNFNKVLSAVASLLAPAYALSMEFR